MPREDGGKDATVEATPRRGVFVSALVAAVLLPLLAALLGLPPFDRADRFGFLPGVGSSDEPDEDTSQVASDPTDEADGADETGGPDEPDHDGTDGADDAAPDGTEAAAGSSPWGPVEHVLRISLCDDVVCPLDDHHIDALRDRLSGDEQVHGYVYLDPESTYDWLTAELEGLADRIDPDRIAGMFHVTLVVGTDPQEATDRYRQADGVSDVAWLTEDLTPEALLAERERLGFDEDSRRVAIHLCDGQRCPTISADDRAALDEALAADPDVLDVTRETPAEAYERFVEAFPDNPEITATMDLDTVPRPLRLTIGADSDASSVVERYLDFEGVEDVIWERHEPG